MKSICNKILSAVCLIFFGVGAYALDIVYPTAYNVNINAPSTFFVGNTNPDESLTINGNKIDVHQSGAFAQKVPLNIGKNVFTIISGCDKKTFVINRKAVLGVAFNNTISANNFKKLDKEKFVYVKNDGTALRSTPIEEGINRLSHLEKDVILKVDGEQYGLYRVVLSENNYAWINKKAVYENIVQDNIESAKLIAKYFSQNSHSKFYKFKLTQRIPYYVEEGNPLVLHLFNTDGSESVMPVNLKYNLSGYDAYYDGDYLVLEVKKKLKLYRFRPLKDTTIVIDAGHGGAEKGAVSCLRDNEKDINLKIALYLYKELCKKGANVYMTRFTDEFVSLNDRVKFSNEKNADIFISIHANSLPDGKDPMKERGTSVYYYYDEAKPLAETILNSMVDRLNTNNDGLYQRSFAVVRNSRALSVLIETAYVINPYDIELLNSEKFQKNCAKAISNAVVEYLKKAQVN
ncbi:N-acetylmuramoyl-L-alanine amidase [bacterium]|nr:N-acetylmuramoyl-L-alanine amidase [bacterium]